MNEVFWVNAPVTMELWRHRDAEPSTAICSYGYKIIPLHKDAFPTPRTPGGARASPPSPILPWLNKPVFIHSITRRPFRFLSAPTYRVLQPLEACRNCCVFPDIRSRSALFIYSGLPRAAGQRAALLPSLINTNTDTPSTPPIVSQAVVLCA